MVAANRFAGRRFGKVRPPSSGPAEPSAREWCHRPSAFIVLSLLAFRPFACSLRYVPVRYLLLTFVLSSSCRLRLARCLLHILRCVRVSAPTTTITTSFLCFKTGFLLVLVLARAVRDIDWNPLRAVVNNRNEEVLCLHSRRLPVFK